MPITCVRSPMIKTRALRLSSLLRVELRRSNVGVAVSTRRTALGSNHWLRLNRTYFAVKSSLDWRQSRYLLHHPSVASRKLSSRTGRGRQFRLDALSFKVSPDEALASFQEWAVKEQGLPIGYLLNLDRVKISAAFAPVYSFDMNIRFVSIDPETGRRRYDLKPEPFSVYKNPVVHVPGLSAYAGYEYRRSLINPIHNTTLVFMRDKTVPFGSWMLRDMQLRNGEKVTISPDPWNATKSRALSVVVEELEFLAREDLGEDISVETELLASRRVYMPTYIIDYSILGGEYRAFISGCDAGSGVSGVSHRAFSLSNSDVMDASNSFLSMAQAAARMNPRLFGPFLPMFFNFAINLFARLFTRIPIISLLGAGFIGFQKILKPWYDNRTAGTEWERQREHEQYMTDHDDHLDDFVDSSGSAKQYFQSHRAFILRYLSGQHAHDEGNYNWYQSWEEWARRQYAKQQEEAQRSYQDAYKKEQRRRGQSTQQRHRQQGRQQEARQEKSGGAKKKEFVWDFDRNDPYSVLGIKSVAGKAEVSQAFRREMLKYHPDTQGRATEAEKERALERSKLITEAYRKIRQRQ